MNVATRIKIPFDDCFFSDVQFQTFLLSVEAALQAGML